jgi:hypothetical protein
VGLRGEVTVRHVKVSNEECKTLEDLEDVFVIWIGQMKRK